jgi:lambda repressor-like predicted transcriptional regulator
MASRVNPKAEYIKYRLKLKGSSPSKIARERGITFTAVWNVIEGRSESMPTKRMIAKITGERIEDLWPDDNEQRAA